VKGAAGAASAAASGAAANPGCSGGLTGTVLAAPLLAGVVAATVRSNNANAHGEAVLLEIACPPGERRRRFRCKAAAGVEVLHIGAAWVSTDGWEARQPLRFYI